MPHIDLSHVRFSYDARPLIDDVNLHIGAGERAFLVGPNGSGKTTLLSLVTQQLTPDHGTVDVNGTIGGMTSDLGRDIPGVTTVDDVLKHELHSVSALAERFEVLTQQIALNPDDPRVVEDYDHLLGEMNAKDVWSLDARIDQVLTGLNLTSLTGEGASRPLDSLSPGQRARLALASLLISRPDCVVVDEPTNHLDRAAVRFLIDLLTDWPGPVLVASHDRDFIESTATVMYDFDTATWEAYRMASGGAAVGGLYQCRGNYRDYLEAKACARGHHERLHTAQQATKRSIHQHRDVSQAIGKGGRRLSTATGMAKKFYSDRAAATATRRTTRDDRDLERLTQREVRKPRHYALTLPLTPAPAGGGIAVSIRGARVEGRLAEVNCELGYGEKLLITGDNGVGKTTLVTWIGAGYPPPDCAGVSSGTVSRDDSVVHVPQRLPRQLDPGFGEERWLRGVGDVGRGVVHPSLWATPIAELSAGNQRRVQLAVAAAQEAKILIIDEPTNYLDVDTIEALQAALAVWEGTLIVVSHDQWLIDAWWGRRLHLSRPDV